MTMEVLETPPVGGKLRFAGMILGLTLAAVQTAGADGIDPEADKILRSMSAYLGGLSNLSVSADVDTEVIDLEGQKLQFSSSATMVAARPNKLYVRRQGVVADLELKFDGETLTVLEKDHNAYHQTKVSDTIDDVLDAVRNELGLDAPAAELFYADAYPSLSDGINDSLYLGTTFVNGVECHHLAFRENEWDWQIWVSAGDEPLPMKYIITTKWLTGAPQHSVRFRDWNTKPQIAENQFAFSAPDGAERLESVSVDELGELVFGEKKQ